MNNEQLIKNKYLLSPWGAERLYYKAYKSHKTYKS